jgi:hypothetical protein
MDTQTSGGFLTVVKDFSPFVAVVSLAISAWVLALRRRAAEAKEFKAMFDSEFQKSCEPLRSKAISDARTGDGKIWDTLNALRADLATVRGEMSMIAQGVRSIQDAINRKGL